MTNPTAKFSRTYRHLYSCILAFFFLFLGISRVDAQGENLAVTASCGFSSDFKAGAWVPVQVMISNQPPSGKSINDIEDFKGQISIASASEESGLEPVQFIRNVDVPKMSSKRFTIYAKFADSITKGTRPRLRLSTENGKLISAYDFDTNVVAQNLLLVADVTSGSSQTSLPRLRDQFAERIRYSAIAPELLSDHWAGYDSADVLFFHAWPAKSLKTETLTAIRQWVQMGGTVVFATGKEAQTYADEAAKDILPVTLKETKRLDELNGRFSISASTGEAIDGKGTSFVVADGDPKPGAETLLQIQGTPLIVRERYGLGQIVYFATDLQSSSSRNFEQLLMPAWQAIAPQPNLAAAESDQSQVLNNFQTLTGRAAKPPNRFIIILFCIAYTIIVGPLNFGILSKKKKLEFAWVTVPIIVMIFFFLIYGIGRLTKGNNDIIREVTIDRSLSGSGLGSSKSVFGTFVSNPGKHTFRPVAENYVLGDAYRWTDFQEFRETQGRLLISNVSSAVASARSAPIVSFEPRLGQIFVNSAEMGTYDAQNFLLEGPLGGENRSIIDADVRWEQGYLTGKIVNKSGHDLENGWVMVGNDGLQTGPLKNGETFALSEAVVSTDAAKNDPVVRFSKKFYTDLYTQFGALTVKDPDTNADVNKNNFSLLMTSAMSPQDTGTFFPPESGRIYFLGYWQEDKFTAATTSIQPSIASSIHAVQAVILPKPPQRGEFVVTEAALKRSMISFDNGDRSRGLTVNNTGIDLQNSLVVMSVELPFSDPNLRVNSFQVTPNLKTNDAQDSFVEVLHWGNTPGWQAVSEGTEMINSDVVLPITGRMYIRLRSDEKKGANAMTSWNAITHITDLKISMRGTIEK